VLVVVRPGAEPLAGRFAVVPRGDTTSPGALVAVRTLVSDVARGVGLDSGEVAISVASGRMSATAAGAGVGVPGAVRLTVDAAFEDVPAPRDSVPCDAAR
jgi:hypothetical protein